MREKYEEATLLYLEIIVALDRGLNQTSQEVGGSGTAGKQLNKKVDVDLVRFRRNFLLWELDVGTIQQLIKFRPE